MRLTITFRCWCEQNLLRKNGFFARCGAKYPIEYPTSSGWSTKRCATPSFRAARITTNSRSADGPRRGAGRSCLQENASGGGRYISEWGYVGQKTQEEHGIEIESPIKTMADFEKYFPPDPAPGRYDPVEKALATYGDHYAVIVHLNDVFSLPAT